MWLNSSSNHLLCLRTNIELRRRGVGSVLYGSGEALQRRPHFLQGHHHIIFNRRFCLTDVAVVPKFYTGSDHRLLRA
ncbi:hypothetical protein V3C99_005069, partial [Haemonchus contortus]